LIRKAKISDIKAIYGILTHFGKKGLMLPRALSDLYDHLRDYAVYTQDGEKVVATVALHIAWEDLAEIRSLGVLEEYQDQGIGNRLVEFALSEATSIGVHRVFTLTYQPDFFKRLGFKEIDKKELPHKIWSDCLRCPKFPDCDEIALMIEL